MIDWKKEFEETARDRERVLNLFCDLSDKYEQLKIKHEETKKELERTRINLEHAMGIINDLYRGSSY